MLGHRGCRLGVTYPEIYEMQARAIFEAACDVAAKSGAAVVPEVMIPLVATKRELELMKAVRSKEHTSELQSLMRMSYAVFCLKKKKKTERRKQEEEERKKS